MLHRSPGSKDTLLSAVTCGLLSQSCARTAFSGPTVRRAVMASILLTTPACQDAGTEENVSVATINGVVSDPGGGPVPDAPVWGGRCGGPVTSALGSDTTDATGRFQFTMVEFPSVPPSELCIWVVAGPTAALGKRHRSSGQHAVRRRVAAGGGDQPHSATRRVAYQLRRDAAA
jgi:hypothetical protein